MKTKMNLLKFFSDVLLSQSLKSLYFIEEKNSVFKYRIQDILYFKPVDLPERI